MTIVQIEDTRNVEWRANNKGSALLQKMGWTEGKGIGKRNCNATALRAVKRQEGLGLGAKLETEGGQSESTSTFAVVLKNLQQHHGSSIDGGSKKETKEKVKKKKARGLVLPQNKVTAGHAQKMRLAKFGEKSADDLACIFGNKNVSMTFSQPVVAAMATPIVETETSTDVCSVKVKARRSKKDKKTKKKRCLETVQEECPSANEDTNKVTKKAKRKIAS
jgi:Pin2-interacting protein X1